MHQLILGSDTALRDRILRDLKTRFLKSPDALRLDLTSLDGHGLDLEELKAALLTVAAVAAKRIVCIRRAEKLNEKNLEFIEHVMANKDAPCVVVLEASSWDKRSTVRKSIAAAVKVSGGEAAPGAFDLLYELPKDRAAVLARLQVLLENDAVENVLGAVRWWWGNKIKGTIPAVRYKKGLLVIQEADERIKLSVLLVKEQVLEVALVKLSLLLKA